MISHRREIMARLNHELEKRNDAFGFLVVGKAQDRIRDYGLIESSRMISTITHKHDEKGVIVGSPISDPPYPFFLHNGFKHHITDELVGPFPFLTEGLMDSKADAEAIYGREIRK